MSRRWPEAIRREAKKSFFSDLDVRYNRLPTDTHDTASYGPAVTKAAKLLQKDGRAELD